MSDLITSREMHKFIIRELLPSLVTRAESRSRRDESSPAVEDFNYASSSLNALCCFAKIVETHENRHQLMDVIYKHYSEHKAIFSSAIMRGGASSYPVAPNFRDFQLDRYDDQEVKRLIEAFVEAAGEQELVTASLSKRKNEPKRPRGVGRGSKARLVAEQLSDPKFVSENLIPAEAEEELPSESDYIEPQQG